MARRSCIPVPLLLALGCTAGTSLLGQEAEVAAYRPWMEAAVDLDRLWAPGVHASEVRTWSVCAPRTPGDPGGTAEQVLVRVDGAGVLARLWLAEPRGVLRFYGRAEAEPFWVVDAADLLRGGAGSPGWPWVSATGGGGLVCRVPVPFTGGLVLTTDASGPVDFQAQVQVSGPGVDASLRPFDPTVLAAGAATWKSIAARLSAERSGTACTVRVPAPEIPSTGTGVLAGAWQGPGVLRATRVRVLGDGVDRDRARRGVSLRFVVDGVDRGAIPLDALRGLSTPGGLGLERVGEDDVDVLRLPVPCRQSLRLELFRDAAPADGTTDARVEVVTEFEQRALPADALGFSVVASRSTALLRSDRHVVVEAVSGPGRFGGMMLLVDQAGDGFWGGGGEAIVADGAPVTRGNGLDAYTGTAFASDRAWVGPFEGQPVVPGAGYRGRTQAYRFHVLDAVPFAERLVVDLEVAPFGAAPFDLTTLAIVYAGASTVLQGAGVVRSPTAGADESGPSAVTPLAVEGEDLAVVSVGGGEHQIQRLNEFAGARWSRDAHLWWLDAEPGDRLVVDVPVPAAGRYRLLACWTTARDYGIARVHVAGEPVGAAFDLYTEQVRNTGLVEHGITPRLEAGKARLEIEIVGRHPKAVPRHMVGLDYVRLVPVREGEAPR